MGRKNKSTEVIDKAIGRKINELRLARGFSRVQVAALIDVTHQQLAKYELGVNRITAGRLMALSTALKVPVGYFFEDIESFVHTDSTHERLLIELSRIFLNMKDSKQQVALVALARTLH